MLSKMRMRFLAYELVDPRDSSVFYVGAGRHSEPRILIEHVRRDVRGNQRPVRATYADTLRDHQIADILDAGLQPAVSPLLDTESRADAVRTAERAQKAHNLRHSRRPINPTLGVPVSAKGLLLVLMLTEGPVYFVLATERIKSRWSLDLQRSALRPAMLGLEMGGYVESHERPNDALRGRPRLWYVLTERGERAARAVLATLALVTSPASPAGPSPRCPEAAPRLHPSAPPEAP